MIQSIESLLCNIDRNDALRMVSGYSSSFTPQIQKRIYYPYYWVHFEYTVKTILGSRTIQAYCLVDLINNQAATADSFQWESLEIEEENILQPEISAETALGTARSYLLHSSIHTMKALLCPEKKVLAEKVMYKPFWIVRFENEKKERFRLLVDGMTGKFQVI